MEKLILIMSICSFIANMFFVISNITGGIFATFIFKIIGLFGVLSSLLYWAKLLNLI